jgi:hypothetical protein
MPLLCPFGIDPASGTIVSGWEIELESGSTPAASLAMARALWLLALALFAEEAVRVAAP